MDPCLPDLFTDKYPAMPGVIMMGSMFCLFVIEMYLNGKMGGHSHSHGGPMGFETHRQPPPAPVQASRDTPPTRPPRYTSATDFETEDIEYEKKIAQKVYEEKMRDYQAQNPFADTDADADANDLARQSEMPPWFVVFYEQYVRQRFEMVNMIKSMGPEHQQQQQYQNSNDTSTKRQTMTTEAPLADSPYVDVETGQPVDPAVFRKMSMNITLLEGGILFHSVFVGMTISITVDGFLVLLVAILFHQMFEGLGLGTRIAEVPYPRGSIRPWVLVVAFGTTAPIGQAIGLIVRDSYDPNSALGLIIVGVFNAM
jgi:zinc transporter ZupT